MCHFRIQFLTIPTSNNSRSHTNNSLITFIIQFSTTSNQYNALVSSSKPKIIININMNLNSRDKSRKIVLLKYLEGSTKRILNTTNIIVIVIVITITMVR